MCNPCLVVWFDTLRSLKELKIQSHVTANRFLKVRRRKNVSFSRCDACLKVCFDTLRGLMVKRHILVGVEAAFRSTKSTIFRHVSVQQTVQYTGEYCTIKLVVVVVVAALSRPELRYCAAA